MITAKTRNRRQASANAATASTIQRIAGFSLIELIVTMAIGLIIAMVGMPTLMSFISRNEIEGTARQLTTTLQLAKLEAIKTGFPAVVRIDTTNNVIQTFLNIDDPGVEWAFDPDESKTYQTTDYLIREISLPAGLSFEGPGGASDRIEGLTSDPGGGDELMVFKASGAILDVGAYRIGDTRGNFLEARVEPRGTARIELRKWDPDLDRWTAAGQEGKSWSWY